VARLENLISCAGSVVHLPFRDDSVPALTTMCVLEHVGLGRYGDPLNPRGTLDAITEIRRVIRPGGIVVYSVPVGVPMVEFNAHRRFRYSEAAEFFKGWHEVDSVLLNPSPLSGVLTDEAVSRFRDAVACFCFRKPIARPVGG
jgi:SAM-dependent methyltransferase